jgi:hypothetical protein
MELLSLSAGLVSPHFHALSLEGLINTSKLNCCMSPFYLSFSSPALIFASLRLQFRLWIRPFCNHSRFLTAPLGPRRTPRCCLGRISALSSLPPHLCSHLPLLSATCFVFHSFLFGLIASSLTLFPYPIDLCCLCHSSFRQRAVFCSASKPLILLFSSFFPHLPFQRVSIVVPPMYIKTCGM